MAETINLQQRIAARREGRAANIPQTWEETGETRDGRFGVEYEYRHPDGRTIWRSDARLDSDEYNGQIMFTENGFRWTTNAEWAARQEELTAEALKESKATARVRE